LIGVIALCRAPAGLFTATGSLPAADEKDGAAQAAAIALAVKMLTVSRVLARVARWWTKDIRRRYRSGKTKRAVGRRGSKKAGRRVSARCGPD
jgi:hypothetical protein